MEVGGKSTHRRARAPACSWISLASSLREHMWAGKPNAKTETAKGMENPIKMSRSMAGCTEHVTPLNRSVASMRRGHRQGTTIRGLNVERIVDTATADGANVHAIALQLGIGD